MRLVWLNSMCLWKQMNDITSATRSLLWGRGWYFQKNMGNVAVDKIWRSTGLPRRSLLQICITFKAKIIAGYMLLYYLYHNHLFSLKGYFSASSSLTSVLLQGNYAKRFVVARWMKLRCRSTQRECRPSLMRKVLYNSNIAVSAFLAGRGEYEQAKQVHQHTKRRFVTWK